MDIRELDRWDPTVLQSLGDAFARQAEGIDDVRGFVAGAAQEPRRWLGRDRDAAQEQCRRTADLIAGHTESLRRIGGCAHMFAPRLQRLHTELGEVRRWAAERGIVVGECVAPVRSDVAAEDVRHVQARIVAIEGKARRLDEEAAAALSRVFDDEPSRPHRFGPEGVFRPVVRIPVPGTDPAEAAAWWAGLDEGTRADLLTRRPEDLGVLDGLPASVRDQANRAVLRLERERLDEVAGFLRDEASSVPMGAFLDVDSSLTMLERKLAAIDVLEETLQADDRHLVALDLSGREAMAAVAVGDLDTADRVAVYTPGAGSTVQGSLKNYDEQVAALQNRAQLLLGEGNGTAAAVTWMNYEAPHFGWGLAYTERSPVSDLAATIAAPRLSSFLDGLDASRPDSVPHVTAIGHSYGSLVTSYALQEGADVDAAVFLGSPGLGVTDIEPLGLEPGTGYLVEARRDIVADAGTFGRDPSALPGLTHLSTDERVVDGVVLAESVGHSQYLVPHTASAFHVASVVAGADPGGRVR